VGPYVYASLRNPRDQAKANASRRFRFRCLSSRIPKPNTHTHTPRSTKHRIHDVSRSIHSRGRERRSDGQSIYISWLPGWLHRDRPDTRRDKPYLYPSNTTTHDTSTGTTLTALTYTLIGCFGPGRRNTASIHLFHQSSSPSRAALPTSSAPAVTSQLPTRPPIHPEERPVICRLVCMRVGGTASERVGATNRHPAATWPISERACVCPNASLQRRPAHSPSATDIQRGMWEVIRRGRLAVGWAQTRDERCVLAGHWSVASGIVLSRQPLVGGCCRQCVEASGGRVEGQLTSRPAACRPQ